jgi:hypothetical protein
VGNVCPDASPDIAPLVAGLSTFMDEKHASQRRRKGQAWS